MLKKCRHLSKTVFTSCSGNISGATTQKPIVLQLLKPREMVCVDVSLVLIWRFIHRWCYCRRKWNNSIAWGVKDINLCSAVIWCIHCKDPKIVSIWYFFYFHCARTRRAYAAWLLVPARWTASKKNSKHCKRQRVGLKVQWYFYGLWSMLRSCDPFKLQSVCF